LIAAVGMMLIAVVAFYGCDSQSVPDGTSEEMYEIGCDALDALDEALDNNDLFNPQLQDKLKTLSVKARDASRNSEDGQYNNSEILSCIQGASICLSQNDGDGVMEHVDKLRSALGK